MSAYLPILMLFILGIVFAAGSFLASTLLGPSKPTEAKLAAYECGIVTEYEPARRFPVKFYLVAMIFIIFDIEVIFLYPFALVFKQLELFGLLAMGAFLLAVIVAYAYLLSSGALSWGVAGRANTPEVRPLIRSANRQPEVVEVPAREVA
ncbi:MAG: NADH-quinone oxidoreductase subunit A [Acidimicrobiia bacterium]|nr:NADH-quinone oxidoreductase subunit A [Acidimicrobiia bacterium]MBP8180643.1 NADH-quinone oxidoreductase subunit A [Acidimicrobiia bacterium]